MIATLMPREVPALFQGDHMVSAVMALNPEVSIIHSESPELPISPDASAALGSASYLAMLLCIKAKPYAGMALIPKTQTCSRSQKGNWSSQSSRNHDKSPSAER